jgi:Ca-activated chloride channel family protein
MKKQALFDSVNPIEIAMVQPAVLLSPIKPGIPASGGTLEVMVRVQAPDQPIDNQHKVTPKRLALVVDRSGSTDGQPLAEALKCALHIAERMTAADQMAVVVYDDKVDPWCH